MSAREELWFSVANPFYEESGGNLSSTTLEAMSRMRGRFILAIEDAERRARDKALEEAASLVTSLVNTRHTPHDMRVLADIIRTLIAQDPQP